MSEPGTQLDAEECDALIAALPEALRHRLEQEQQDVVAPRWDLDPPQREEYAGAEAYVDALALYAARAVEANR